MEEQRQIAAEEANAMPDLSSQEQSMMKERFESQHLKEESVRPDGNCLYAAFASQLNRIKSDKVPWWIFLIIVRLQIAESYGGVVYPGP
jgi:hypothetical protein